MAPKPLIPIPMPSITTRTKHRSQPHHIERSNNPSKPRMVKN